MEMIRPNAEHLPWFGEMERRPDEDKLVQLYEAALSGSVPTLSTLLRSDPQILHRVSLSANPETPLHISALAGHLGFTKALLTRKPELASRLDSQRCSPLHLASAEGHTEIVKALLEVNINVCLVPDAEGRIPLHLAAIRGKVEIIQELFDAQPNSIHQKVNGNSVLHLCIQYNHLEALRRLVALVKENQLLDFRDQGGNTILHLAVMLRQIETVRYLASIPKIKTGINALNRIGISALDVLEYSARDFKFLEIRDILIRAVTVNVNNTQVLQPIANGEIDHIDLERCPGPDRLRFTKLKRIIKSGYRKFDRYCKEREDWVERRHKTLMLVATLIAAMSFQVVSNPPGGVWQQDYNSTSVDFCGNYSIDSICHAGHAAMAYAYPLAYRYLIICATISFISSLSVVLLAISGLPLKNKFSTGLLTTAMVIGITFMISTYICTLLLVAPEHIFPQAITTSVMASRFWLGLLGLIGLFAAIRLVIWLSIGFFSFKRKMLRRPPSSTNSPISI